MGGRLTGLTPTPGYGPEADNSQFRGTQPYLTQCDLDPSRCQLHIESCTCWAAIDLCDQKKVDELCQQYCGY